MKKLIAITALTGLIAVGCAHRDKDNTNNSGGSYDNSSSTTGQDKSSTKWNSSDTKNNSDASKSDSLKDGSSSPAPQQ